MTTAREITAAQTVQEFEHWLMFAEPGAVCEYHRGQTCLVNDKGSKRLPVAELAWEMGPALLGVSGDCQAHKPKSRRLGRGVVELAQYRHGEHDYSYLAIKREQPGPHAA